MKHTQLKIKIILSFFLLFILVYLSACGDKIKKGHYLISEDILKYKTDTTIESFTMIDIYGISDEFVMDKTWYSPHSYFYKAGKGLYFESFGVAYKSVLNNYFFMFTLRASDNTTDIEVDWNYKDRIRLDYKENKLYYDFCCGADLKFYDSLQVRNFIYRDIIELDYSKSINSIEEKTPVRTWISGKYGLIKFETKNGIINERVMVN